MEITLALGGGGAKGNSHIGVIRRLEKEGFIIRSVAGTSFGGIVAIFYAAGYSPDDIQKIFEDVDQGRLYGRDPEDGPSLLGISGVRKLLNHVVGGKTFDDLRIPCAVTAVDVKSGDEVIISKGTLVDALLSTTALPGIFPVQRMNGWELVDGGVLNPVPVSVARMLSPNLPVVAVILNDPMDKPVPTYTIPMPQILPRSIVERISRMNFAQSLDIFLRAVDVSSRAVAHFRLELDKPDVLIRPAVHHINLLDKVVVADVAMLGEQATEEMLPQIKRAVSWPVRISKRIFGVTK
ncbi:patatin-like phospholipase family protein [Candidatus Villigracilis affinis]|uniref:patatin-like phospholipase family protein n=1 Tax=Candidatus Villigracilis affinis TaxID=3140682 RepID=UPI002A236310|nr:patatin-like phospholipase family protein [Anaerolineales bacterium]